MTHNDHYLYYKKETKYIYDELIHAFQQHK